VGQQQALQQPALQQQGLSRESLAWECSAWGTAEALGWRQALQQQALADFAGQVAALEHGADRATAEFIQLLGGDAELELVDSLDPFAEGIVFSVRPPKKSWKNISNLSGGEKTLSSLALVFALHHFKPTPLYVMDEIDAALDFKNVSIVANYIKERTKNAQFIIISLRNNMFEMADRLVGIYKVRDVTRSVTISPKIISASAGIGMGSATGAAVGAGSGI
jgi:DNA repair ATPase RecN